MASKSAVLRLIPQLRPELSRANALRFDQALALIPENGQANLAAVLTALYPGSPRETALSLFRQFRQAISEAAKEAKISFTIQTDGQTKARPENRVVSVDAENLVSLTVEREVNPLVEPKP